MRKLVAAAKLRMTLADKRRIMMLLLLLKEHRQLVKKAFLKFMERLKRRNRQKEKRRLDWPKSLRRFDFSVSTLMQMLQWLKNRLGSNLKLVKSVKSETTRMRD